MFGLVNKILLLPLSSSLYEGYWDKILLNYLLFDVFFGFADDISALFCSLALFLADDPALLVCIF
jgi:hypothetical protein